MANKGLFQNELVSYYIKYITPVKLHVDSSLYKNGLGKFWDSTTIIELIKGKT